MRYSKDGIEFISRIAIVRDVRFTWRLGAVALVTAVALVMLPPSKVMSATEASEASKDAVLTRILSDRTLWGRDLPVVLASLPAFEKAGERRVAVFADRVVGETKYNSREDAQREAGKLEQEMRTGPAKFNLQFEMLLKRGFQQRVVPLKTEIIQSADDKTIRVVAIGHGREFLAPGLTVASVRKGLGQEEKSTKEVLDNGAERRPVILTLYHYAGGAVIFAESDWAPRYGLIDRAILDLPAAKAALFQEAK